MTIWATDEEKAKLKQQLDRLGFKNPAELLKAIREGTVKVSPQVKALALTALANEQGGCLGLLVALAVPLLGAVTTYVLAS